MKARFDSKPLKLAAKVRTKSLDGAIGYVTRMGLLRLKRGGNTKVEVYFPARVARGYTFMEQRMFLASFLRVEAIAEAGLFSDAGGGVRALGSGGGSLRGGTLPEGSPPALTTSQRHPGRALVAEVYPGTASSEEIAELLGALSDVYIACGGEGFRYVSSESALGEQA